MNLNPYSLIGWINNSAPSINKANLDHMDERIKYLDSESAGILEIVGGSRVDIITLRNGTMQNSGNTNAITTAYRSTPGDFIPVSEGDEIYVFPLKPLSNSAAHYCFGWGAFDNNTVSGQTPISYKGYSADMTFENIFPLKIQSGWNYITLDFTSYIGDTVQPLRVANYTKDDFLVVNLKNNILTDALKDLLYDIPFAVDKMNVILENGATFSGAGASANYVHVGANSVAGREKAAQVEEGDYINVTIRKPVKASGNYYGYDIVTIDANNAYVRNPNNATRKPGEALRINAGEKYCCVNIAEYNSSGELVGTNIADFSDGDVEIVVFKKNSILSLIENEIQKKTRFFYGNPMLRNGTLNNSANANCVSSTYTIPTFGAKKITMHIDMAFQYGMWVAFRKFSVYTENQLSGSTTNQIANYSPINSQKEIFEKLNDNTCIIDVSDCAAFSFSIGDNDSLDGGSHTHILRVASYQNFVEILYEYEMKSANGGGDGESIVGRVKNARHIPYDSASDPKPLTILHFSDIHGDSAALNRIYQYAEDYNENELIDDIICTGDIVPNTATTIASWWKSKILTCIGNHDSASYNAETGYNWTALSMADRVSYYISPFEANWGGIVRDSGKSYYYKDYADAKVRMIVMDGMLYTNPTSDADAQTTWLGNVMDGANALGYHVLIAIHGPHDGAVPTDCSFGKRNQTVMPLHSSCHTPQEVVDVVANKISGGVKFIGYLVGHTHQDDIWDCEDDGKQLMYCVTCAAVDQTAQWYKSDQFRDRTLDAFNIVTIDTKNHIVKIIRGGGANIDNAMRNRKQIAFDYYTGQIIGEDE